MAEPALLDPSPFDLRHYPAHLFDPDLPLAAGGDEDLPLGAFDGLDFDLPGDFSVEDFLLRSPERDDSGEGSAAGSGPTASPSSSPTTSASNSAVANGSCEVKHEESDEGRSGADPKWSLKRKQSSPGLSSDVAKCRRSGDGDVSPSASASRTAVDSDEGGTVCEEEDKRRAARLMRNRESAQLSRQRKKRYVEELEDKVKSMNSVINDLNSRISFVMAENATLRQQLSGGSANLPPPGVYPPPIPGMHFPWVPPGYAMRPHGSHVPLVPIPRLKPQQPVPASKVAKKPESKKSGENKNKTKTKTKKVASVSLLGLLLIMLVFGAFIPGFNHNFGMGGQSDNVVFRNFGQSHARVLSVSSQDKSGLNNSEMFGVDVGKMAGNADGPGKKHQPAQNSSEILPALLYVPRNGKHVKINGNLIIHSVLASEKAVAHKASKGDSDQSAKDHKETSVAIARYLSLPGRDMNRQETPSADGPLPQWFREGMAGPILNSGMCSEVFQFDISAASSNPGGVIPASPIVNSSSVNATEKIPAHSAAYQGKLKNRRVMYNEAIPLTGKTANNTEPFNRTSESSSKLPDSKPASSVVVSVLADPREAGNGDGDPRVSPKPLSKIFVVVLVDGARYVTYSCTLPFKSASPHLVN
ncbi:bZIP transcription factor 39 [Oryza brachyantha]|uniref:bZIP transcription factor 39 n=1 Tax=Oryza brachyantha TaxID=4533 RepID=UPI001ADA135F|nr:bZIP transcription factor 39 [Oryza brachyantha]